MRKKSSPETVKSYVADAKALSRLFPSLKKYARRKTLKPQEKAAISRARNIFNIVETLPNDQRPEKLREYTYPARRKKKDQAYIREAKKLAELGFDNFDKYKGRKKLKASEKAAITRARKKSRFLSDLYPLPKKEAKKLKQNIRFPVPGLNAIKLRNIETPTRANGIKRKIRVTDYGLGISILFPSGLKRFYKFVFTGPDIDLMIEAAADLFSEGAKQVNVWINHGFSSEGHTELDRFAAMLGDEQALREVSAQTNVPMNLIASGGYSVLIKEDDYESDDFKTKLAEAVWIYGVIGVFETREKRKKPYPDYSMR